MENRLQNKVTISARVFRVKQQKPRYVPSFVWEWCKRRKFRFAGHWEDLGVVASSDQRTAQVI